MTDPFWDWTYACSTHLHAQCSKRLRSGACGCPCHEEES